MALQILYSLEYIAEGPVGGRVGLSGSSVMEIGDDVQCDWHRDDLYAALQTSCVVTAWVMLCGDGLLRAEVAVIQNNNPADR